MYNSFKKNSAAYNFIENARKSGSEGEGMGMKVLYIPKMLEEIKKIDTESYEIFTDNMNKFHPKLIMNMLDDPSDGDVAMKIKRSCEAYLGLKIEHLGVIYRDSIQDIALASRLPVTIYKPGSLISEAIFRIADKILSSPENDVFIGTNDDVDASFEDAATTAESDFENKLQYVEELLHSGALSEGDLIETVKTQSMEITKLKKENSFLKLKLTRAAEKGFKV
jgi:flagellar biosynthesis protein FlhG